MSEEWYNGPSDPPYLAFVYKYKYTNIFPPENVDTLENVRKHYDKIGLRYGFDFKLKKPFVVSLDYYPVGIDDMWKLAPTIRCGKSEIGQVKDIRISEDGNDLIVETSGATIAFHYPGIGRRARSIAKSEKYNDDADERDREEEAFRRSL